MEAGRKYEVSRWEGKINSDTCVGSHQRDISLWREYGTWVFSDFIASFAWVIEGEGGVERIQRKHVAGVLESKGSASEESKSL